MVATTSTKPPSPMAGTRWVLGALLRGCGCSYSTCRHTGAACLPLRPSSSSSSSSSPPSPSAGALGLCGRRRRLLLLLGAATQSRGVASSAGPVPGFGSSWRGSLLAPPLAGRCYSQVGRGGRLCGGGRRRRMPPFSPSPSPLSYFTLYILNICYNF